RPDVIYAAAMGKGGANRFGCSRVAQGMTERIGRISPADMASMTARVEQLAWMTLAGGWLAAFMVTAGVANFVRPYRTAWAASGDGR
ncbi:MAG TPA: hypothetical protein VF516_44420, partial [Kofleriaceae bacterium]